jgi:hypothetical protein
MVPDTDLSFLASDDGKRRCHEYLIQKFGWFDHAVRTENDLIQIRSNGLERATLAPAHPHQ